MSEVAKDTEQTSQENPQSPSSQDDKQTPQGNKQSSQEDKQISQEKKQSSQDNKQTSQGKKQSSQGNKQPKLNVGHKYYQVKFRMKGHIHSASSKIQNLADNELVMVATDHGQEPAKVSGQGVVLPLDGLKKTPAFYTIARRASRDENSKFENLVNREKEALSFCRASIKNLQLNMKLIRVERYFNGSKIVFYFTAENRVDFRALVKELVQEFRTRVEMRQIGVRHETQMLGGLGCCGRELCCASFMTKFVPVSIKMAKEQNLPLNPSKISGACNRLLCCLTHEFDTYKRLKKEMPKPGNIIELDGEKYKINKINILKSSVNVTSLDNSDTTVDLTRDQWQNAKIVGSSPRQHESGKQQDSRKKQGARKQQESRKKQEPKKHKDSRNKQESRKPRGARKKQEPQKQHASRKQNEPKNQQSHAKNNRKRTLRKGKK